MAQDVWEELLASTVGDNQSIQIELIDLLVSYNDLPSAVQWARHYGIDHSQLPDAVVEELQKSVETRWVARFCVCIFLDVCVAICLVSVCGCLFGKCVST